MVYNAGTLPPNVHRTPVHRTRILRSTGRVIGATNTITVSLSLGLPTYKTHTHTLPLRSKTFNTVDPNYLRLIINVPI